MKTKRFEIRKISPKLNDLPLETELQVVLVNSAKNQHGDTCLTPRLLTKKEIDVYFDGLVEELNGLRKRAKKLIDQ